MSREEIIKMKEYGKKSAVLDLQRLKGFAILSVLTRDF